MLKYKEEEMLQHHAMHSMYGVSTMGQALITLGALRGLR